MQPEKSQPAEDDIRAHVFATSMLSCFAVVVVLDLYGWLAWLPCSSSFACVIGGGAAGLLVNLARPPVSQATGGWKRFYEILCGHTPPKPTPQIVWGKEFDFGDYGNTRGVVFFSPSAHDQPREVLSVSDNHIDSLFDAIMDRARNGSGDGQAPLRVVEWHRDGGTMMGQRLSIPATDAADLAAALALLGPADFGEDSYAEQIEKDLRCAAVIRQFLLSCVERGRDVFIGRC